MFGVIRAGRGIYGSRCVGSTRVQARQSLRAVLGIDLLRRPSHRAPGMLSGFRGFSDIARWRVAFLVGLGGHCATSLKYPHLVEKE